MFGGETFERDDVLAQQGLPVFVSSVASPGDFGAGLGESVADAADAFCTNLASYAGMADYEWSAWLSDDDNDAQSA